MHNKKLSYCYKNSVEWNLFLMFWENSILYFLKSTAKQDYFIKYRGVKKQYC